jgi:hypothetical protein
MPSTETPEEQMARCLAIMGKDPEELADYLAQHTRAQKKASPPPARKEVPRA